MNYTKDYSMMQSTKCPKCKYESAEAFEVCPMCGVVIEKFLDALSQPHVIQKPNKPSGFERVSFNTRLVIYTGVLLLAGTVLLICKLKNQPVEGCINENQGEKEKQGKIILELKKIQSLLQMGVSYREYREMLISKKPEIEALCYEIPPNEFREDAENALQAYVDAHDFWKRTMEHPYGWDNEAGKSVYQFSPDEIARYRKYGIHWNSGEFATSDDVQQIWRYAMLKIMALELKHTGTAHISLD